MGSMLLLVPTPCFCSWVFRSGSWAFWPVCILLSIICSNCASTQLLLVPYSFTVFCCSRRRVFRCKHCSKGSQVPTSLMGNFPLFAVHLSPSPTNTCHRITRKDRRMMQQLCRGSSSRLWGFRSYELREDSPWVSRNLSIGGDSQTPQNSAIYVTVTILLSLSHVSNQLHIFSSFFHFSGSEIKPKLIPHLLFSFRALTMVFNYVYLCAWSPGHDQGKIAEFYLFSAVKD